MITLFLTLELPVGSQEFLVRSDICRLPLLPVCVLEPVVNAFQCIRSGFHRCIITIMKDIKLVSCEELLKNVFVFFQDVFHQHICLFDESANSWLVSASPKSAIVLEDLQSLWVAEKIAEEPKLPDRLIRQAGVDVSRLHSFIDNRPSIPAFEHSSHLTLIILTCLEATFPCRLRQLRVRARVGQCVGKGIARIPR